MLDHMSDTYTEILKSGGSHEDYIMDLYSALLSTKNEVFKSFIQRSKDDWETGSNVSAEELIAMSTEKYNNMYRQNKWKINSSSDSKLVALATQVKELQNQLKNSSNKKGGGKDDQPKKEQYEIAKWRKTKSFGTTVEKDGRTWHWCGIGHNNGKGMYVTHKEEDHGKRFKKKDPKSKEKPGNDKGGKDKTLTLSDSLKAAMVTRFKCSNEEAAKLYADVVKDKDHF